MKRIAIATLALSSLSLAGCMHSVHMDPIQVEPVQVTMDVNVRIQDERPDEAEDADTPPETARTGG